MQRPRDRVRINAGETCSNIGLNQKLGARHRANFILFMLEAFITLVVHLKDSPIADMPNMDSTNRWVWLIAVGCYFLPML